ncbi:unnamed protein product [Ceratitis capitata]|uniref:(Mediterranean fruit fly) hypothetical protein n=1 Tax=Ceratitis capitata TaxID=7213 RepID=A0A811V650_CERCA|nr:unnamed protein product [Ceratitis capitata]
MQPRVQYNGPSEYAYYNQNNVPLLTGMSLACGCCCCLIWAMYLLFLATFIFGVICLFRLALGLRSATGEHWRPIALQAWGLLIWTVFVFISTGTVKAPEVEQHRADLMLYTDDDYIYTDFKFVDTI